MKQEGSVGVSKGFRTSFSFFVLFFAGRLAEIKGVCCHESALCFLDNYKLMRNKKDMREAS